MDNRLEHILRRGVSEIIVKDELVTLLKSGKKLRLKEGFDPSSPDIHLGHMVGLRKLRQFQELGHRVFLIVGDWTAQIGDPSGVSVTRPPLSEETVRANAETYLEQFFKIVDKDRTEVRWQSEWYNSFNLKEILNLTSKFTIAQFLAREDFNKRYHEGRPITLTEFIYPLLQAYDSVAIKADCEFGGTDQKFNLLVGRGLQQMLGQPAQQIFTVPLLVGTDGVNKMSKSLGNYIGVSEAPDSIFGKVMSIPDSLISQYFELLTDVPDKELATFKSSLGDGSLNPMNLKKRLAAEIITQLYSARAAREADAHFTRVFQKREIPEEVEEYYLTKEIIAKIQGTEPVIEIGRITIDGYLVSMPALLVETGLARSRSEARRLIEQGAIDVDDNTVTENEWRIKTGSIVKAGKRRFVRIKNAEKNKEGER